MTIKEMEEKAGLARANIRFYEAEGLFTPERKPNGYRDYSQEDLTTLLRVRLLRSLGVSLEDIKAVQAGDLPLAEVLGRHLDHLAEDKDKLTRAEGVCREMREAGEDYAHLDAEKYLEALTRPQPVPVPAPVPESDAIPKVRSPWRRFFARDLDAILYGMVLDGIFLACGLNHLIYTAFYSYGSSGQRNLMFFLAIGLGLLLTFVLEPVLLHWFGTTPGKALLGLHVRSPEGGKLSYDQAVFRTGDVLLRGMGLCIPVVGWIQEVRCYSACEKGKTLPWEEDTVLVLRDSKAWRTVAFVVLYAAVNLLSFGISSMAALPANRGDLTVAQFCQNFNRQADRLGYAKARLEPDGSWRLLDHGDTFAIEDELGPDLPELRFTEKDGTVTGLTFAFQGEGQDFYASWGQRETALALWAFVGAQEDCGVFHRDLDHRYEDLLEAPIHSFDDTLYGVRVKCDADWEGEPGAFLARGEDGPAAFSMAVTMKKL